jgi:hypothetical protein
MVSAAQIDPRERPRQAALMPFEDDIAAPVAVRTFTFSNLFIGCGRPLKLQCKHAGFSNPGLTSGQLKAFNDRQARRGGSTAGKAVTPEMIEADRVLDAQLFAKHVVVGWDEDEQGQPSGATVYEDGKPVPFSVNKCQELLLAISKKRLDLFRLLTNWASDGDNFTDAPPVGDPANLGK